MKRKNLVGIAAAVVVLGAAGYAYAGPQEEIFFGKNKGQAVVNDRENFNQHMDAQTKVMQDILAAIQENTKVLKDMNQQKSDADNKQLVTLLKGLKALFDEQKESLAALAGKAPQPAAGQH